MNNKIISLIEKGIITRDNIKIDSREIEPGDIFVAINGTKTDGHNYVREALGKGAHYAVCDGSGPGGPGSLAENIIFAGDTMGLLGDMLSRLYDGLFDGFFLYGVTGTNGKTTTAFMIRNILNVSGSDSGLISTVYINTREEEYIKAKMTTPDILSVYRHLFSMKNNGKDSSVIEISSHALDQERISGIKLDSAVFTNITPEHLDYHKNMETYLEDKMKIFDHLNPEGISVLNNDDKVLSGIIGKHGFRNLVTFAIENDADVTASDINVCREGTRLTIKSKGNFDIEDVCLRIHGRHNIYNVLAAVAALSRRGLTENSIRAGIESFNPVPGRLDMVRSNSGFSVFVDYAHTPDALANILKSVRGLCDGKLICVFGCGGDRDKSKRPEMGKIASDLSDYVILTNDNPRTEDPLAIIEQIEKGIRSNNNYCIITDRYKAILEALKKAKPGDVVLIAGKGHEDYQILGDKTVPFDDRIASEKALREIGF